jgi:hypothetical protein
MSFKLVELKFGQCDIIGIPSASHAFQIRRFLGLVDFTLLTFPVRCMSLKFVEVKFDQFDFIGNGRALHVIHRTRFGVSSIGSYRNFECIDCRPIYLVFDSHIIQLTNRCTGMCRTWRTNVCCDADWYMCIYVCCVRLEQLWLLRYRRSPLHVVIVWVATHPCFRWISHGT